MCYKFCEFQILVSNSRFVASNSEKSKTNHPQECDCNPRRVVTPMGVLTKKEKRSYPSGIGLKVSMQCGEKMLHCVFFHGTAMLNIFGAFDVGKEVTFKAIILKSGERHDLGRIFHVLGDYAQKAAWQREEGEDSN